MAIADHCRGRVFKGRTLPYGTLTMDAEDSEIRSAYYTYGYRKDEDIPALPIIEPDDQVVDPEEEVSRAELRRIVEEVLNTLPPRCAKVLCMRFGIGMDRDMTLEEVGDVFGVSRERIRQIEAKALRLMKNPDRKLREVVFPEDAQRRVIKDRAVLRERMFEIEMMQMGWALYQRKLNAHVNPHRHPKATSWIEHIELTHPQLHRNIAYEVNRYLDDIFANRLRSSHDDGRAQTQGRTQRLAQARL